MSAEAWVKRSRKIELIRAAQAKKDNDDKDKSDNNSQFYQQILYF